MNTTYEVANKFNINRDLVIGINKRLKEGVHYNMQMLDKKRKYGYKYTDAGISKINATLEELNHLKAKLQQMFTSYSGHDSIKNRSGQSIKVKTAIAVALRENGYSYSEIAFMFDYERTTLYNTFKNYDYQVFFNEFERQDIEDYKEIALRIIDGGVNVN